MKKSIAVLCIGFFLAVMPLGMSACDCEQPAQNQTIENTVTQGPLTAADITALQIQGEQEGWTFTVGENAATQRPFSQLCGLVEPTDWWVGASFDPCTPKRGLPVTFDWRELGGCTSIKDQGNCGSCWAFGTVAPLECNILIKDHIEVDLSEQWLVSCNRDGWSCNGGWFAHTYHKSKTDSCSGTGAVLESSFPYEAYNVPCNCPYTHPYTIQNWKYIGSSQGIPSVASMKQAIMDYGPISVAVAVNSAFGAYNGGVFNNDSYAQINHAVALVGWDDTQGTNGVWFLRNSWSPGWGEDGYMRIEYGVCKVGYAACYVNYIGAQTQLNLTIKGGAGVTIAVNNIGTAFANYPTWNVSVTGGFLNRVNVVQQFNTSYIQPSNSTSEKLGVFGLGPITIQVNAEAQNAPQISKQAHGFLLFGIVFLQSQQ